MRIRLIKKKTIEKFCIQNATSRPSYVEWINKLKSADWTNINDIKETYGSADILGKSSNRVVFNISGNNYRMICTYKFGRKYVHLFINGIGSHAEYTKICDNNQQYTINKY